MHSPFFGAEIQPKLLVFCYLGFLPGFSLVFCCLPHPCTVFSKKTKLSCSGGFFFGFLNPSNCLVFLEFITCWNKDQMEILFFYLYLIKVEHSKEDIQTYHSFCKETNKVPPPSSLYIAHKICQIWLICKGRKPRSKKSKEEAENQRTAWLCIAESRKPGFLDKNSSVHTPSGSDSTLPNRCEVWGGWKGWWETHGGKGDRHRTEERMSENKMPERSWLEIKSLEVGQYKDTGNL